jgi:outer membrane lipoprotein SlyB
MSTSKTWIVAAAAAIGLAACAAPGDPYSTTSPTAQYPAYPTYPTAQYPSPQPMTYGYVESIEAAPAEPRNEGIGVGAIGGAVAGGVLGNQVGHGTGRAAATIGGAVLGGIVGHEVEQRVRGNPASGDSTFRVRMDDGSYQSFRMDSRSNIHVGDRVRVEGGTLYPM